MVDLHGETISYKALEKTGKSMTFSGHLHWKLKPMGFLPSLFHLNLGFPLHLEDLEAITNINIIQDCFGKGM